MKFYKSFKFKLILIFEFPMQNHGKVIDNKRSNVASRHNQPSITSALGFVQNEQLRNRSSMWKYQTLHKDHAFRSSYSPNPKKNCYREPSPLSWKVGNSKNNTTTSGSIKTKSYNVNKKAQKANSSFGHYNTIM